MSETIQIRAVKEIETEKAQVLAECDKLEMKSRSDTGLSPEDAVAYDEYLAKGEALTSELDNARRSERLVEQKNRMAQPTRPAPAVLSNVHVANGSKEATEAEAFKLFLQSHGEDKDLSPTAHYKARSHNYQLGATSHKWDINYDALSFERRRFISKTANSDWDWTSFSSKVTEYFLLTSPILGLVASETVPTGVPRDYFIYDDTANKSSNMNASSGTEVAPHYPDTDVESGVKRITPKDITAGYTKITWNIARDNPINLQQRVMRSITGYHARKMADDLFNRTGDGQTEVEGLLHVANVLDDVTEFDSDAIDSLVFNMPDQYRPNCVFAANGPTTAKVRKGMKDTLGRSLFDRDGSNGFEWNVLGGYKYIIDPNMPDDKLLFFQPEHYQLVIVEGLNMSVLTEKFHPHTAIASHMSFSGAWLGPLDGSSFATTAYVLPLTEGS